MASSRNPHCSQWVQNADESVMDCQRARVASTAQHPEQPSGSEKVTTQPANLSFDEKPAVTDVEADTITYQSSLNSPTSTGSFSLNDDDQERLPKRGDSSLVDRMCDELKRSTTYATPFPAAELTPPSSPLTAAGQSPSSTSPFVRRESFQPLHTSPDLTPASYAKTLKAPSTSTTAPWERPSGSMRTLGRKGTIPADNPSRAQGPSLRGRPPSIWKDSVRSKTDKTTEKPGDGGLAWKEMIKEDGDEMIGGYDGAADIKNVFDQAPKSHSQVWRRSDHHGEPSSNKVIGGYDGAADIRSAFRAPHAVRSSVWRRSGHDSDRASNEMIEGCDGASDVKRALIPGPEMRGQVWGRSGHNSDRSGNEMIGGHDGASDVKVVPIPESEMRSQVWRRFGDVVSRPARWKVSTVGYATDRRAVRSVEKKWLEGGAWR